MTIDTPTPPADPNKLPLPSREFDARLHEIFVGSVLRLNSGMFDKGRPVPHYTASIDAARFLMRRALPGWELQMTEGRDAVAVEITPPEDAEDGRSLHLLFHEPERLASALVAAIVAAELELQLRERRAPDAAGLHAIEEGQGLYLDMRAGQRIEAEPAPAATEPAFD
jgi:hypothetical protein